MARKDPVTRMDYAFPKKRIGVALMGLVFTAIMAIMERIFKSVLDTAISAVAGISAVLLLLGILGFFGAWEKREDIIEAKIEGMNAQMKLSRDEFNMRCQSCEFSHQSLLVGLSATHVNKIQEQREFYEDYIMALLYALDDAIIMKLRAESSVLPIVEALLQSPLYRIKPNNEELKKWRTFLKEIEN